MPTFVQLAAPAFTARKTLLGTNIRCAKVGYRAWANVYHKSTTTCDRDCTPVNCPHGDSLDEGIENVFSITSLLSAGERERETYTCVDTRIVRKLSVQNMCVALVTDM